MVNAAQRWTTPDILRAVRSVIIVDDESDYRGRLIDCLSRTSAVSVIGETGSGAEAIEMAARLRPDVVLMDIELGSEPDGITAAHTIRERHPATGIVIMSLHRDKQYIASLPADRAAGWSYLLKQSVKDPQAVVRAIESAAEGLASIDQSIVTSLKARPGSGLSALTDDQIMVLELMAAGFHDAAIATSALLDESAVRALAEGIYQTLGIPDDGSVDRRIQAVLTYLTETKRG